MHRDLPVRPLATVNVRTRTVCVMELMMVETSGDVLTQDLLPMGGAATWSTTLSPRATTACAMGENFVIVP